MRMKDLLSRPRWRLEKDLSMKKLMLHWSCSACEKGIELKVWARRRVMVGRGAERRRCSVTPQERCNEDTTKDQVRYKIQFWSEEILFMRLMRLRPRSNLHQSGPGFLLVISVCAALIAEDYILIHFTSPNVLNYSLTSVFIQMCFHIFMYFVVVAPIVLVVWNLVLSPRFEIKRINLFDAAILAAAAYWTHF